MRKTSLSRHTPLTADRETTARFVERGRQNRKPQRQAISPTSAAQKRYVRSEGHCMFCGAERSEYVALTFAHWWPRGRGGCDSELCGSVMCVRPGGDGCHDRFDRGELPDFLPVVVADWERWRSRYQHALEHALPVELVERLACARIEWRGL